RLELAFADAALNLHVLDARLRPVAGFPQKLASAATSPLSWAFLGGGGEEEGRAMRRALLWGSEDGKLNAMFADGQRIPGFPLATGFLVSAQPAVADLDGTGELAIAVASQDFKLYVVDAATGDLLPGFPVSTGARLKDSPALARLDAASMDLSLAVAAADGRLHVLTKAGKPRAGFPARLADRLVGAPLAVDLDGDDRDELIVASADGKLHALRHTGRPFPGFPAPLKGLPDKGPIAFAWEGALLVAQGAGETLHVFRVRSQATPKRPPSWPMPGHDSAHSGRIWPNMPLYRDLALSPEKPTVTDPIELAYRFVDLDGQSEPPLQIRWLRNGREMPSAPNARTLPAGMARKGETWTAEIAVSHARVLGKPSVVVRNTPPGKPTLAFEPSHPTRQSGVRAVIATPAVDPDSDPITYTYRWFIDGHLDAKLKGESIGPNVLKRGTHVSVEVVASDGTDRSDPVRLETSVGNSAPGVPTAHLTNRSPKCGEELAFVIDRSATDADGDALTYRASVAIAGHPTPITHDRTQIPTSAARKGEVIAVALSAFDGQDQGAPIELDATVVNCPPTRPVAAFAPLNPLAGDTLEGRLATLSTDWDGDSLTYRFAFFKSGKPVGERVAGVKKGELYELQVVASDGSAQVSSERVSVRVGNTPPSAPRLAWKAEAPRATDQLEVSVRAPAIDPDGDNVTYRYAWTRDGQPVAGESASKLTSAQLRKGERWEVNVTPFDGTDVGLPARLAIVIQNTPPPAPTVELNPANPSEREAVRAIVTPKDKDADGDNVTFRFRWFVDDLELSLDPSASELPTGTLAAAQHLMVVVTPFDGTDVGEPARAEAEVRPGAPEAPKLALDPASPAIGDELECRVEGPLGTNERLDFEWFVDGQTQRLSPSLARFSTSSARAGQSIHCAVTRLKGTLSARAESPPALVRNVAPTAPSIAIEPSLPRSGDDLFCRVVTPAKDPNAGNIRYDYRWFADDAPIAPRSDAPWQLKATDLRRGPVYRCEVTAHNEVGASPKATAEQRYANTLPGAPQVRLTPENATARDALNCELSEEAPDPDGDALTYRFVWWKNGVEQPLASTTQRIPDRMTQPDERWRCGAEAQDAEGTGPRHQSVEVRLAP
ncbi:MAG: hypothetical protein LBM75_07765, partial [Myxococcales bacterium]|nr:hypothetical protein [Myxococcales bacterium]